jgi:hypothetical protein
MRRFVGALVMLVIVGALFIVGITGNLPGLAIAGFCAWSPVVFFAGWAFAQTSIRVVVGDNRQRVATSGRMRRDAVSEI